MYPTVGNKMQSGDSSAWGWSTCGSKSDIAVFTYVVWDAVLSCVFSAMVIGHSTKPPEREFRVLGRNPRVTTVFFYVAWDRLPP